MSVHLWGFEKNIHGWLYLGGRLWLWGAKIKGGNTSCDFSYC